MVNQVKLIGFAKPFYDYPLPPQSTEIGREAFVYTISQSGTSMCNYSASRTIRSSLSHDDVRRYYYSVFFDGIGDESASIALSGNIATGKLGADVSFDETDPEIAVITLDDGPYFGNFIAFDMRCWSPAGPSFR